MLADLYRLAGWTDAGLRAVEEGFAYAEASGEGGYLAELHRAKAELQRLVNDESGAEASFHEALRYAGTQQAKSFELRAAIGLARLMAHHRRPAEARMVLAPVYGWFTEGLETADLVAAKTLLDRV